MYTEQYEFTVHDRFDLDEGSIRREAESSAESYAQFMVNNSQGMTQLTLMSLHLVGKRLESGGTTYVFAAIFERIDNER